jgi:4-amino-4-deoxy-L-arabinose transferase-like glycosyltransferase
VPCPFMDMSAPHSLQENTGKAILGAFLLGMLAVFLLFLAYPYGLIAPDTQQYLTIGQTLFHPTEQIGDTTRGPALPIILRMATLTPFPGAIIVWVNGLLFALCIALTAWMGCLLFKKAYLGFLLAAFLLLVELCINQPFFYSAFALTDAPAAFLLFAGTLFALGGWMTSSNRILFLGFLCLGLSETFRPMLLIPFFWGIGGLWIYLHRHKKALLRRWMIASLAVLIVPICVWNLRNSIVYKKITPNPYIGGHLMTHAIPLWTDDEPVVNTAFHTALRTSVIPPEYQGPPLFGHLSGKWNVIYTFVASQVPLVKEHGWHPDIYPEDLYEKQFLAIFSHIAIHTIERHPLGYLSSINDKYVSMYDYAIPNYLQDFMHASSVQTYAEMWADPTTPKALKNLFLAQQQTASMTVSSAASGFLYRLSLAIRYRTFFAGFDPVFFFLVHVSAVCGCLLFFSKKFREKLSLQKAEGQAIGILMVLLFLTAALFYLAIAFLTLLQDTRYSTPGMMPLHLLLLLTGMVFLRGCVLQIQKYF